MKRALAAVLALAALGASVLPFASEARDRRCMRSSRAGRTFDCAGYAFFEAFPASGAGTTGPCSTTAPTGAKGETLTFTRASTAYCTKTASGGLATTGIANGDLVSMSNGQPRVEYDSAGVLGLRVEGARTNQLLWSQQLNAAYWVRESNSVALPTVSVDYANSPDGTTSADRVEFPATTTGQFTGLRAMPTALVSTTATLTIYAKGTSANGTIDICGRNSGITYACNACSYVQSFWTRCSLTVTLHSMDPYIYFGNMTSVNGGTARSAADVLLWNAQAEAGAYATSPILTTTAAVQRVAEIAYFDIGAGKAPAANSASIAISINSVSATKTGQYPGAIYLSDVFPYSTDRNVFSLSSPATFGASYRCSVGNSAATAFFTGSANSTASFRAWCSSSGTVTGAVDSTSMTASGALSGSFGANQYISIGTAAGYSGAGGSQIDGIASKACVDPDPTRCR